MRRIPILAAVLSTLVLSACSGGGGTDPVAAPAPTLYSGVLNGPVIAGLDYASCGAFACSNSGRTDATGAFQHQQDQTLVMSVGTLEFFRASGVFEGRVLDLSATRDESDPAFLNKMAFLLTIDEDLNATNGVTLSAFTQALLKDKTLNFNQTAERFANDGNVQSYVNQITATQPSGVRTLYSAAAVQKHLLDTYFKKQYQGDWQFYFDDAKIPDGALSTIVTEGGALSGAGEAGNAGEQTIAASIERTSSLEAGLNGGVPGGMSMIGTLKADGTGKGSYTLNKTGQVVTGTWTAIKGPKPEGTTAF